MARTIDIRDLATPILRNLPAAINSQRMAAVIGQAVANTVRGHLFRLDGERPNKLGGDRTHFYSGAAKATSYTAEPGQATVNINAVGFRQRLEGGVIRPVKGKFLTIPATAEAHGRRASEFNNLRFAVLGGHPALIEAQATTLKIGGKRKDGSRNISGASTSTGLKVFFWLARSVNQQPDPTVLPPDSEMVDAAVTAANLAISQSLRKGGARNV